MPNFAEVRVPVMLDKERFMRFNGNTFSAYEEVTGKFFLDTVAKLYEAMKPVFEQAKEEGRKLGVADPPLKKMEIARRIPMKDIRALIWAAVHEYDDKDNPKWPLTINQVGRYITSNNVASLFLKFLEGQSKNSPTEEEMGESPAPSEPGSADGAKKALTIAPEDGGEPGIELPASAFA